MENNKSIALLTIGELQHLIKVNISENMSSLKNNILEEYLKPELTIEDVWYILKCSRTTIHKYLKLGLIKYKLGTTLFNRDEILKFKKSKNHGC